MDLLYVCIYECTHVWCMYVCICTYLCMYACNFMYVCMYVLRFYVGKYVYEYKCYLDTLFQFVSLFVFLVRLLFYFLCFK
jgi:hypothetical protein